MHKLQTWAKFLGPRLRWYDIQTQHKIAIWNWCSVNSEVWYFFYFIQDTFDTKLYMMSIITFAYICNVYLLRNETIFRIYTKVEDNWYRKCIQWIVEREYLENMMVVEVPSFPLQCVPLLCSITIKTWYTMVICFYRVYC